MIILLIISYDYFTFNCVVRATDKRIACDEEFSDSEDEGESGNRRNRVSYRRDHKRIKTEEAEKREESKGLAYCS